MATEHDEEEVALEKHDIENQNERGEEEFGIPPSEPAETTEIEPKTQKKTTSTKSDDDGTGFLGPRRKRIFAFCCLLLWICILVFPLWSEYNQVSGTEWVNAYKLHEGGAVIIFIGVILILIGVSLEGRVRCCNNRIVRLVPTCILLLGAFIYWVGGIQLAKCINDIGRKDDKEHKYYLSGWAGTAFIEATFIALISIMLSIDYFSNFLSKNERGRIILVLNTILTFTALVAFFSYAAWRGYGKSGLSISRTSCVSAGWFFVLLGCLYLYVVEFVEVCCKCVKTAQMCVRERRPAVNMAAVVIILFGALIVMFGMWSLGALSDKKWNAYYVGYGFFVFFYCCLFVFDVHLGQLLEQKSTKK